LVVWKLKNVVSYYKLGVAIGTIVVYDFPRETEQFLNCFLASSGSVFRMIFPVAMHCNQLQEQAHCLSNYFEFLCCLAL
jgi:hypothetical protein